MIPKELKEARAKVLLNMLGREVEVHKIGDVDPTKVEGGCSYVPLPEYGVCILSRYIEEEVNNNA